MRQDASMARGPAGNPEKSAQSRKLEKNLYEPYSTPRVFYEALRAFLIFIFVIIARIRLRTRYHLPRKGPYIIAANHLSWTDVPLVPLYVPGKVVYMAKEEAFTSKKIGWLVRFLGAFPIRRGEGDRQSLRVASDLLKQGKVLVIFPEGTRSKTHTMAKGLAGLGMIALRAQVPVVPVAIWGSENVLRKFGAEVTISYGEPILLKPKGEKVTRDDINEATEVIMHKIASMLPPQYRGVYSNIE